MKIVINTIAGDVPVCAEWIIKNTEDFCQEFHHRLFLVTDQQKELFVGKGRQIPLNPPAGKIAFKLWERTVFSHELKKIRPDMVITWNYLLPKEHFKQIVVYPFEGNEPVLPRRIKPDYPEETAFIVFSEKQKRILRQFLKVKEDRIYCIYRIPNRRKSVRDKKIQGTEDLYAGANAFFLASGFKSKESFIMLLKSFSIFKKWQHSGMELQIACDGEQEKMWLSELLKNYRFRDSVMIADRNKEDYFKILSSAYAVIFEDGFNPPPGDLIFAMELGECIIIPRGYLFEEITGDRSAFFYQFQDKNSLAQVMLEVFREEDEREQRARHAREVAAGFSEDYFDREMQKILDGEITRYP